ncbi:MAG: ion transporter [Magnetococcales bacterium]|nr:ion transporter [Magnetococcales bacterium]
MLKLFSDILASRSFQNGIVGVILFNAAVLGVLTSRNLSPVTVEILEWLDHACLVIFCIELVLKLMVQQLRFFRDGWNVFDFIVVAIALLPATGSLSVLRAMRVLRLMRLVSSMPSMRKVISGMFCSMPGVASVAGVLLVIFYVSAILAIGIFRELDPEKFGNLGLTFFTLFQLMTTEGWPTMAREMMKTLPYAWLFFVPFIIFTTFTTLNLVVGIIVNGMEEAKEESAREEMAAQGVHVSEESNEVRIAMIRNDVKKISDDLMKLEAAMERQIAVRLAARSEIPSRLEENS